MPELIVKLEDTILQTCRFDGELLRIGRSRENDVVIENLSVSRHHGQIRLHEGRYILTDMNSSNGILVNGTRVTKADLGNNDVVTIGKHKLIFQMVPGDCPTMLDEPPPPPPAIVRRPPPAEPKAEAWLTIESGRLKDREFRITRFETSLGKAPTNDVVLTDDWLLGKKQAIILRKGNFGFEVQDLGGLRRVKVNGNIITDRADLKNQDVLELGGTRMIFHAAGMVQKDKGGELSPATPIRPFPAPAIPDEPVKAALPYLNDNDSLDLEEFNHRHPKAAQNPPQTTPVTPAPATIAANAPDAAQPIPAPSAGPFASVASSNGSTGDNNHRKHSRGKRHQRAAQSAPAAQSKATAAKAAPPPLTPTAAQGPSGPPANAAVSSAADEKEIRIWEQALQNGSPAIRRQAIRTLKKLTGRDYEA